MRRRLAYYFLLILLMLAGCAKRPASAWRVITAPPPQLLVPPRPAAPSTLGKDSVVLKSARSRARGGPACGVALPGFALSWKGHEARVDVDTEALLPRAVGVEATLPDGSRRMLPGVSVEKNWFQLLPAALDEKAAAGCLSAGEALMLPARLASHLTLPPSIGSRLLYGDPAQTGYLDLEPGFVLKSVTPIRESDQVVGYLTAYYRAKTDGRGGVRVSPGEAETNVRGKLTRGVAPDHPVLHLPKQATRLRLFLRTWSVAQDRRIALVAAPDVAMLDKASHAFETDPEGFCSAAENREAACVAIAKDSVLHAEVSVLAKGSPIFLQAGSTLGMALKPLGLKPDNALPATLAIQRPWNGKLVPVEFPKEQGMLSFVLWNGDVVTW